MNSQTENPSNPGSTPTPPLEPGRPDVMPNPPGVDGGQPSKEGEQPLNPDNGVSEEEDMGDVEVNNSVSQENPPQQ